MGRFSGILERLPAAALALATVFALTLWQPNVMRLPWEDALPTVAALLAIVFVLVALIRSWSGSWRRASLMAAVWVAYCFYAPSLVGYVSSDTRLRWAALAVLALFAWDVSRRVPAKTDALALGKVNRLANLTLLPYALILAGVLGMQVARLESQRPDPRAQFALPAPPPAHNGPDVWHFVFDRYASQDTLARVYNYDNQPFLDELRKRGFTVSGGAFSNYQRTAHSVTSTLNSAYLDRLGQAGAQSNDWVPLYRAMTDNAALRMFKSAGHETVFAGSWWNPTRTSAVADRNINYRAMPQLARLMLGQSVPGRAMAAFGLPYADGRREQCDRTHFKFSQLARLAGEPGPKYVFAHFLVPHPPFVLNADGSCRSLQAAQSATRAQNYTGQVSYVNREILTLIDKIRAGPRPATIVLHADEGPWPEPHVGNEHGLGSDPVSVDWPRIGRDKLREKMGILMAVRHADGRPAAPQLSPINVYPAVLNHDFGMSLPLQQDRHFVFNSDTALYTFTEVGPVLRQD